MQENSTTKFKYGIEVEQIYTKAKDECIKEWIKTGNNQIIIVYGGINGYKFGTGVWASSISKDDTIQDIIQSHLKQQDDLTVNDIIHTAFIENGVIHIDGVPSLKIKKLGKGYKIVEIPQNS